MVERTMTQRLTVRPLTLRAANAYVAKHHRHNKPVVGCRFCLGVTLDDELVGVSIVGRPLARRLDDGMTAEVLRVCTTGQRNACSILYGAASRAWRAMGGRLLITYTRQDEPGSSLRGAGWVVDGYTAAGSWNSPSRPREDQTEIVPRVRWCPQWCHQVEAA